jgi:hypothetical protein
MLEKYYTRTDLSPFYAMALILNPGFRTRYIRANWPKKYATSALTSAKKFWEHYGDQVIPPPSSNIIPFSYGKGLSQEPLALDSFDLLTPVCQYERFRNRALRLINRDPLWLPIN